MTLRNLLTNYLLRQGANIYKSTHLKLITVKCNESRYDYFYENDRKKFYGKGNVHKKGKTIVL